MRVVDAPDHHPLIVRLFDGAALAGRRAYEALFRELVAASRFAERALVFGGGERALINTWHLLELLLDEVARSRCDLHELVGTLQRWITDGADVPDDRDVQRAETDGDAVRILTVHKAKGLEAPFVFVYGAASPPRASNVHALRDGAGRALVVGPQDESIEKQLAAETDAEHQRLAYVALTRAAKVRLYLPRYPDDAVDKKSMYWQIQRCFAPLVERHCRAVRGDSRSRWARRLQRRRRLRTRWPASTPSRRHLLRSSSPRSTAFAQASPWCRTRALGASSTRRSLEGHAEPGGADLARAPSWTRVAGRDRSSGVRYRSLVRDCYVRAFSDLADLRDARSASCRPASTAACSCTTCSSASISTCCAARLTPTRGSRSRASRRWSPSSRSRGALRRRITPMQRGSCTRR